MHRDISNPVTILTILAVEAVLFSGRVHLICPKIALIVLSWYRLESRGAAEGQCARVCCFDVDRSLGEGLGEDDVGGNLSFCEAAVATRR